MRNARRLGASPSFETAQKVAAADLEHVERYAPPAPDVSRKPKERTESPAADIATDMGGRFERREIDIKEKEHVPLLDPNKLKATAGLKAAAMVARYKELLARAPASQARNTDRANFLFPAFAKDLLAIHSDHLHGRRDFRGLKPRDKRRVWIRKVEDICDRSTGILGPWWVR